MKIVSRHNRAGKAPHHSVDGVLLKQHCQSCAVGQIGDFKRCVNRYIGLARIGRHQRVAIGRETAEQRRADQASDAGDKDVAQSLPAPG